MNRKLLFALLYVFVDTVYVTLSKSFYGSIQGAEMTTSIASIIGAYLCMALGWYYLVDTTFKGFLYGLAVYGVFNFTNHILFKGYTWNVVARDFLWGVSWTTLLTMLYTRTEF